MPCGAPTPDGSTCVYQLGHAGPHQSLGQLTGSRPANKVEIVHTPMHAGVSVELIQSVQGVSMEVKINRPREPGEAYEVCARAAVDLMIQTWADAKMHVEGTLGLTLGKAPTPPKEK